MGFSLVPIDVKYLSVSLSVCLSDYVKYLSVSLSVGLSDFEHLPEFWSDDPEKLFEHNVGILLFFTTKYFLKVAPLVGKK